MPPAEKTAARRDQAAHKKLLAPGEPFARRGRPRLTETAERPVGVLFGKGAAHVLTKGAGYGVPMARADETGRRAVEKEIIPFDGVPIVETMTALRSWAPCSDADRVASVADTATSPLLFAARSAPERTGFAASSGLGRVPSRTYRAAASNALAAPVAID
jgi:hypothetical protein